MTQASIPIHPSLDHLLQHSKCAIIHACAQIATTVVVGGGVEQWDVAVLRRLREELQCEHDVHSGTYPRFKLLEGLLPIEVEKIDSSLEALLQQDKASDVEIILQVVIFACLTPDGVPSPIAPPVTEYDARSRALVYYLGGDLGLDPEDIAACEKLISQRLAQQSMATTTTVSDADVAITSASLVDKIVERHASDSQLGRWAATGATAALGAAALAFTGGLAAPVIAAGMGLCAITTTAIVTPLLGIAGGGLAGYKMARRTADLDGLTFYPVMRPIASPIPSVSVSILVPGYLLHDNDLPSPLGSEVGASTDTKSPAVLDVAAACLPGDAFTAVFEPAILREFGSALESFLKEQAITAAASTALKHTAAASIVGALSLPGAALSGAYIIDNPWTMAVDRAKKAGAVLADVLMERVHGHRPVTLIGYSVGALTIFECLQSLARKQVCGIVQTVVLLGAPLVASDHAAWTLAGSVVAGAIINGYSRNDWVLKYLSRIELLSSSIAGLDPVQLAAADEHETEESRRVMPRVVNVDLTVHVNGHGGYLDRLVDILDFLAEDHPGIVV